METVFMCVPPCVCVLNNMSDIVRTLQKMFLHNHESQYRNDTSAGEVSGSEPATSVSSGGDGRAKRTKINKNKFHL